MFWFETVTARTCNHCWSPGCDRKPLKVQTQKTQTVLKTWQLPKHPPAKASSREGPPSRFREHAAMASSGLWGLQRHEAPWSCESSVTSSVSVSRAGGLGTAAGGCGALGTRGRRENIVERSVDDPGRAQSGGDTILSWS